MKLTHLTIKELQAMDFSVLSERQLQEVIAEILMRILDSSCRSESEDE